MHTSKSIRALVALFASASLAQAGTLLNDSFADGDRTTQDLPNSAAYYFGAASSNGTVEVTSEALRFNYATTGNTLSQAVTYFTAAGSPVSLNVGDTLTVGFSFSGTEIVNSADSLRIGLYNSGGNRVGADTSGISDAAFNGYTGYGLWANLNAAGSDSTDLVQRSKSSTTLFSGSAHSNLVASTATLGYTAGETYSLSLRIERSGEDSVTVSFSDSLGYAKSAIDSDSPYTTFDTFALFLSNGDALTSYTIDNIQIEVAAIPEPGTFALAMAGFAGLFAFWRKRAARV